MLTCFFNSLGSTKYRLSNPIMQQDELLDLISSTRSHDLLNRLGDWRVQLLSDSLARIGAANISKDPRLAYRYLQMAKSLDASYDPILAVLILVSAKKSDFLVKGSGIERRLLSESLHFPTYVGPRLHEYVELITNLLLERSIIDESNTANWTEYLIDRGEIELAAKILAAVPAKAVSRDAALMLQSARLASASTAPDSDIHLLEKTLKVSPDTLPTLIPLAHLFEQFPDVSKVESGLQSYQGQESAVPDRLPRPGL